MRLSNPDVDLAMKILTERVGALLSGGGPSVGFVLLVQPDDGGLAILSNATAVQQVVDVLHEALDAIDDDRYPTMGNA